jgi:hypothetical protein
MAANAAEDERIARQMQEVETGQAPRFAHGGVVRGVAVHPHVVSVGAPRVSAGPVIVEAIPDLPSDEFVVLSLRYTVMCSGLVDFVIQFLRAVFFWVGFVQCRREECEAITGVPLWTLGSIQIALIIGPLCGIIGARRLQRGLVSVYLCFCMFNLFCQPVFGCSGMYHVALAADLWLFKHRSRMYTFVLAADLWFVVTLAVQIWITWIACKFWSALDIIPKDRAVQMRGPGYLEKAPVRIVYW